MTHASQILDLIEKLRAGGEQFCIATVVRTANLTSAKAGAKAVVTRDGEIHGFVGGGCVTGAVRKAALEAIKTGRPNLVRIRPKEEVNGTIDEDGAPLFKSGCPSGGTVELFMEPTLAAGLMAVALEVELMEVTLAGGPVAPTRERRMGSRPIADLRGQRSAPS